MPNDCHLFSMSGPQSEIVQKCTKLLEVILKKKKEQIWTNLDKAGEEVGSNVFGRGFSPPPLRELLGV